jgi:hypothetical protein
MSPCREGHIFRARWSTAEVKRRIPKKRREARHENETKDLIHAAKREQVRSREISKNLNDHISDIGKVLKQGASPTSYKISLGMVGRPSKQQRDLLSRTPFGLPPLLAGFTLACLDGRSSIDGAVRPEMGSEGLCILSRPDNIWVAPTMTKL